jgi:nucleotide-binding universal stress UspA family protein
MMTIQQEASTTPVPSSNYTKILVGYDGSKNSERALLRSATLAKELGASLTVLVAVNTTVLTFSPISPPVPAEVYQDVLNNGKETLGNAIKTAQSIVPGASGIVEEGNAGECIPNFAARSGIDLIVLGRRGMSGVERFLLGGVSSNVIAHSNCDVLIVK